MIRFGAVLLIFLLPGCTTYEYNLVSPGESARHVGKSDQIVQIDPIEYRLNSVDSRLVVRIFNRTNTPMTLLGPESAVVDPDGQSHPVPTLPIPAGSYLKIILPPPEQVVETNAPAFGFGLAASSGGERASDVYNNAYYAETVRQQTIADNDPRFWRWKGEGQARLILCIVQPGGKLVHEFVFARVKTS